MSTPRRRRLVTAAAALGGLALFVWAVHRAGAGEIVAGLRRVGWGFLLLLAVGGLRFLLRAEAWRLCMPREARLPVGQALRAFLAGDALGNVTPLGPLASEPAKAFLVRHRLATREAVASLALDNLLYAASIVGMVALGLVVLLATVPLPIGGREAALAALLVLAAGTAIALRLIRRGIWRDRRGERPRWREALASARRTLLARAAAEGTPIGRILALDALFHALAVLEVFLTLRWLLGDGSATLALAIVFEALNRVVTVVFKFVPFRVGVDEASAGALAALLAVSPAAGVTLAVVRKARNLVWAGIGLLCTVVRPIRAAEMPGAADHR